MICFRIVREHNGSIKVKSKENEGTTVEGRLPIKTCQ
ncbi:HAMP domain-containing histidine kinase [Bacillus sp. FJAT-49732]|uniref:HAMP domain-containing histidine kinase n=1 Tax=Lederbergia citrisecunda TaxID=2833583 RepID=A0A942YL14_9BACI|nr:HAMP domain-containing histidine kinase [Lederbergia citrisecunda]